MGNQYIWCQRQDWSLSRDLLLETSICDTYVEFYQRVSVALRETTFISGDIDNLISFISCFQLYVGCQGSNAGDNLRLAFWNALV